MKKIVVLLFFAGIYLLSGQPVWADLAPPCGQDDIAIGPGPLGIQVENFNPREYQKISRSFFTATYCVNAEEFCSKEKNQETSACLEYRKSFWFPLINNIYNLPVNFLINLLIVTFLYWQNKIKFGSLIKAMPLLKIILLTLWGYLVDLIPPPNDSLVYYLSVFIPVSLLFYFFYSQNISLIKEKRISSSLIFGFLSNPFWYWLFGALFLR